MTLVKMYGVISYLTRILKNSSTIRYLCFIALACLLFQYASGDR